MQRFRKGAGFHKPADRTTKLDRNQKARIIFCAEQRELNSKLPGKKDGIIGQSGLRVLRCLLQQFHNASTGLCFPSYTAIQARSGLCRQAVTDGLHRLELAGVITILRRLRREGWRLLQDTNSYLFKQPLPRHPPSLFNREEPPVQNLYPYRRPSPLLSMPLSAALQALGDSIQERMLTEGSG
jgi:hypothetical protein